jgi:hypothetical protein
MPKKSSLFGLLWRQIEHLWNNGEPERSFWVNCKSKRLDSPQDSCSRPGKDLNFDVEPALAQAR